MEFHVYNDAQGLHFQIVVSPALLRFFHFLSLKRKHERTPGLHAGAYQVRDDFDDPLPEDFLITGTCGERDAITRPAKWGRDAGGING